MLSVELVYKGRAEAYYNWQKPFSKVHRFLTALGMTSKEKDG
jgi:hypothetical protein